MIAEEVRIERSVLALFQGYDLLKSYKIVIYAIRHLSKILRILMFLKIFCHYLNLFSQLQLHSI